MKRSMFQSLQGMRLHDLVEHGRFREALECYRGFGHARLRSDPEHQLLAADAAARMGDLPLGGTLASSAFEQFTAIALTKGQMRASNLLGAIDFERGQVASAQIHFRRALELAQAIGDSRMSAKAQNNLAIIADLRGQPESAITLYKDACRVLIELSDHRGAAEASHNLGLVYRHLGQLAQAAHAAADAVRFAQQSGARALMALTLLGQAEIEMEHGHLEEARRAIVRGAALAAEAEDQLNGLEAGRLRALLAFRQGDFVVAHHLAEIAGSVSAAVGSAILRAECGAISALSLRALRRDQEATRCRAEVVGELRELGAAELLERFERAWVN